ncbi:ferredoxin [Streptomyces sp. NPDC026672]|uniref:ferredoxin n=1 Tax=unclassified Streptomyces TaxID=2593676 RepID=UPI0033EE0F07
MKITVDQERCVASGQCVLVAPDLFDQRDEDGVVVLLADRPERARLPEARQAADLCPALAIAVDER